MSRSSTWEIELPPNIESLGQEHLNKVCSCRRRVFTTEEDKYLAELVTSKECTNWFEVAQKIPGRTPRQCRDRWTNYLCPTNSFEPWTQEEDQKVIDRVNELGTRWSMIAKLIPGRSDNCIKNRWYSGLKAQCALDAHGKYYLRAASRAKKSSSLDASKSSIQKHHEKVSSSNSLPDTTISNGNNAAQSSKKSQTKVLTQDFKISNSDVSQPMLIQQPSQTLIQQQPQTLIQHQPQTAAQPISQKMNQQPTYFIQQQQIQMMQQPFFQYQMQLQQQVQFQPQQMQLQPISFFVPEYDQADLKPSFEQPQANDDDLEAETDDFWDKQLYKQIVGISQDPFNAAPDLFGEWF